MNKQEKILNLVNQLIQQSLYRDILENGKLEDGDSWEVHHLRLLKNLIEDYFKYEN